MHRHVSLLTVIVMALGWAGIAIAQPVVVPFDFSRSAIGLDVVVRGVPLYMLLDTGVNPSVIDSDRADALRLPVDRGSGGEATGFGDGKGASIYPSGVDGLTIQGHAFAHFDAMAMSMQPLSAHYGRRVDGILGYGFLSDKIILIDYPRHLLGIFEQPSEARSRTRECRLGWSVPLRTEDSFPVIPNFRFGNAVAPVTLDTGSNGGIGLFRSALDLPGMGAALIEKGVVSHAGARGDAKAKSYRLDRAVGFGPFHLPAGQTATLHSDQGSVDTRVANIGNTLFAAMQLKVVLDYRSKTMGFYGDCR
jgi:hypothetical protein